MAMFHSSFSMPPSYRCEPPDNQVWLENSEGTSVSTLENPDCDPLRCSGIFMARQAGTLDKASNNDQ